jgi:hypothetical protein
MLKAVIIYLTAETHIEITSAAINTFKDKTKRALLWMHLLHEPFVVLYALLPFILRKDLGASLLQISILSALRPTLPIFSFYWSVNVTNQKHRLRANLMGAWIFARLPFLFVPWIDTVWYLIFACAIYELFNKSGIPALVEILKTNIPKGERENILTFCFVLTFLESIALGLWIANALDHSPIMWQWLCSGTALLGLTSLFAQWHIPMRFDTQINLPKRTLLEKIATPWKETLTLLKTKPDFAQFQYGFMMGGFGLMLIAPSLAVFYVDSLGLSYATVVTGRSILMGIGIVASSHFWKEALKKHPPKRLTFWVLIGFGLYPLFLLFAPTHVIWFYLSFILYGIAQAGSHLLWNLSGTLFAQDEDSSPYSRVNILMLGLRGAIAPALGGILCHWLGPIPLFVLGAACCLGGALYVAKTLPHLSSAKVLSE